MMMMMMMMIEGWWNGRLGKTDEDDG